MDTAKKVLVVEDEQPLAQAIRLKLEKHGFAVTLARTAEQAWNYLSDLGGVDAIWLDHYLMGKEDGLDFLAKVKKEGGEWSKIPIFVVSNTASPDKMQSYLRLGARNYFVKSDHRLEDIISELKGFVDNPQE